MEITMRRYELIEGKSSKFWEIETHDNQLTVRYGRIGTKGQTQTKEFTDSAAANKERDKLIKKKTDKGYAEITLGADASLIAVVPKEPTDKPKQEAVTAESVADAAAVTQPVAANQKEAPADILPELLREPPWTRKIRPLPTLEFPLLKHSPSIQWSADEQAQHLQYDFFKYNNGYLKEKGQEHPLASRLAPDGDKARLRDLAILLRFEIRDSVHEEVLKGRPLQENDLIDSFWCHSYILPLASPALRLNMWNNLPGDTWTDNKRQSTVNWLLAEHDTEALPGFIAYTQSHIEEGLTWGGRVGHPNKN
jgi:predicted DNA-binding WGR domain protein